MADRFEQCPWLIRWTFGQDLRCALRASHLPADPEHSAMLPNGITRLSWLAGDRREFTGEWPGPCTITEGCVLHTGHHGRCAL